MEDNVTFQYWLKEARESNTDAWREKYDRYINEGMDEDQAREKANRKTLWAVKHVFYENYKEFLSSYLHLKENETHQDIIDDLEEKLDKGVGMTKALNRVIPRYHSKFNGLFEEDDEEEDEGQ